MGCAMFSLCCVGVYPPFRPSVSQSVHACKRLHTIALHITTFQPFLNILKVVFPAFNSETIFQPLLNILEVVFPAFNSETILMIPLAKPQHLHQSFNLTTAPPQEIPLQNLHRRGPILHINSQTLT